MRPVKPSVKPARRDPAPSRAAYRIQRLLLTPVYRRLLRIGLPAFLLAFFGGIYLSDEARREQIRLKVADMRQSVEERPEFMVRLMAIDGAGVSVAREIRESLPLNFPVTAFDLDLKAMRDTIAELDAVARVDVHVRSGGILQIYVVEREAALVWRTRDGTVLLDKTGHRVAAVSDRSARPDLPLIVGDGAGDAVPELLEILAASQKISRRIRGFVRMGERRWDLVLDRDQRILLPAENPVAALERVIALSTAQDMLARDLTVIDMRNGKRPTIRIADDAIEALRRVRTQESGE